MPNKRKPDFSELEGIAEVGPARRPVHDSTPDQDAKILETLAFYGLKNKTEIVFSFNLQIIHCRKD
jgi:hypothetical protein